MLKSHFSSALSLPDTQILGRFLTVSLVGSWLSSGNKNFPPLLFWISLKKPSLVAFKWQAIAPPYHQSSLKVLWCSCPAQVHAPNTQWDHTNQNIGAWSREKFLAGSCKANGWFLPRKVQTPQGVKQSIFKGKVSKRCEWFLQPDVGGAAHLHQVMMFL